MYYVWWPESGRESWNCCNIESIKWNYEIIRWTVKLINMMTYFIKPKFPLCLDVITPIFLMWNSPINTILITPNDGVPAKATFSYFSSASFLYLVGLMPKHICFHFFIPFHYRASFSSMIYTKFALMMKEKKIFERRKKFHNN